MKLQSSKRGFLIRNEKLSSMPFLGTDPDITPRIIVLEIRNKTGHLTHVSIYPIEKDIYAHLPQFVKISFNWQTRELVMLY